MKYLLALFVLLMLSGCVGEVPDVNDLVDGLIPFTAREAYLQTGGNTIELTDASPNVVVSSSVTTGRNAQGVTFPIVCSSGETVTSTWHLDPEIYTQEEIAFWYAQTIIINYDPSSFTCGRKYVFKGYTVNGIYTDTTAELINGYGVKVQVVFTDAGAL